MSQNGSKTRPRTSMYVTAKTPHSSLLPYKKKGVCHLDDCKVNSCHICTYLITQHCLQVEPFCMRVTYGGNIESSSTPAHFCKGVVHGAHYLMLQIAACMCKSGATGPGMELFFFSFFANHTAPKWRPELDLIFSDFEKAPCGHRTTVFTCCALLLMTSKLVFV